MSADTLPYASLLGLASVLDEWLAERGLIADEDGDVRTLNVADADALVHRLASGGFVVAESPK